MANVDKIERTPSGAIVASFTDAAGVSQTAYVDVGTGRIIGTADSSGAFATWLKSFHRSLMLGDNGRWLSGAGAAMLVLLSISGLALLIARTGGLRKIFDRAKGAAPARLHTTLSRLAILPLVVTAVTGTYIVLTDFEIVPVTEANSVLSAQSTPSTSRVAPGALKGLAQLPLSQLTSLSFPLADDPLDVFTARTTAGVVVIDQWSGSVLERVPRTSSETLSGWVKALHTGEGLPWVGALLGIASLAVPLLGITGVLVWRRRTQAGSHRVKGNQPAASADTIILVGSEGGVTWGFARSLHAALTAAGHRIHVNAMNNFAPNYAKARRIIFLTSTYGSGAAPGSADCFQSKLAETTSAPDASFAVLGFGDRAFAHYCEFAKDINADLTNHGWTPLLPLTLINRQSSQSFASWGVDLGDALGQPLALNHEIELPPTRRMVLVQRVLLGEKVDAPTAILTFRHVDRAAAWPLRFGSRGDRGYEPGDLLGVLPPGSRTPRYYSVGTIISPDEIDVCVRLMSGGECSTYLHRLAIGDEIESFGKANPEFRLPPGGKPVILIGAGTGIAPFVGMIEGNRQRRPLHLFWGGRDPGSDFLYEASLKTCLADRRLATLETAFSRVEDRAYVQDRLHQSAPKLAAMLSKGASAMVCGGDEMASAVRAEFESILETIYLSVVRLKSKGLYLEDVY